MRCYEQSGKWQGRRLRLGVWILIVACPFPALALTQEELDASRDLWNVNGSSDYDYFMQRSCFCIESYTRPGLVQVRSDVITGVTDADTHQPLDPQFFLTIDGLFDKLQDAVDAPAFSIQSEFDDTFGYPTNIGIDFIQNAVDDEIFYTAGDLRLVPEPVSFQLAIFGLLGILCRRPCSRPTGRNAG